MTACSKTRGPALDGGLLVHLEFDRERSGPDGDWLAYLYLPNGRMLNAELIRVGLARPRTDGRNLRYLDLFEELVSKDAAPAAGALTRRPAGAGADSPRPSATSRGCSRSPSPP